jgi:hypothetical protein
MRGKRRFSDVDVERARLLHQYALNRPSADAQRLAGASGASPHIFRSRRGDWKRICY